MKGAKGVQGVQGSPDRLDEPARLRFANRVKTETIVLLAAAAYFVFAAKSARADTGNGPSSPDVSTGTSSPNVGETVTTIGDRFWDAVSPWLPEPGAPAAPADPATDLTQ